MTQSGAIVGTPTYMSPEQAVGDSRTIGPAADIYSLGVVLYEMLTGHPPHQGASTLETLELIRLQEPISPRAWQPRLPIDLNTICLKCLHKEPSRRYASALGLAEDLERFLDGHPIQARPVGALERSWKWTRRRPAVVGLLAALLAVIVISLATVTNLWLEAESQRSVADDTSRDARDAIRESFTLAIQAPVFQQDGMQQARQLLLDKALRYFQNFAKRRGDDLALRLDLVDAHERVAEILSDRSMYREALTEVEAALELLRKVLRDEPSNQAWQRRVAEDLIDIGRIKSRLGEFERASASLQEALQTYERLNGLSPDESKYALGVAQCRLQMAFLYYQRGEFTTAVDEFRQAQQGLDRATGERVPETRANCLVGLGHALKDLGRPVEAAVAYEQAIEIREQLLTSNPFPAYRSELARAYGSLGQAKELAGEHAAALANFQRAIELREKLTALNPLVPSYRYDLALSYKTMADARHEPSEFDDAFLFLTKSVESFAQLAGESPGNADYQYALAVSRSELAWLYRRFKNQPELALEQLNLSTKPLEELIRQQVATPAHRFGLAQIYAEVALLHQQAEKLELALEWFPKSNALLEELAAASTDSPDYPSQLSRNYANMAYCYQQSGKFEEGTRFLVNVLIIREQLAAKFPQVPEHRQRLDKTREDMATSVESLLSQPAATKPHEPSTLASQAAQVPDRGESLYQVAVGLARCIPLAEASSSTPLPAANGASTIPTAEPLTSEHESQGQKYVDQALAVLRQAHARGFKDWKRVEQEPAFVPLRSGDSFQLLLNELKAQPQASAKQ